MLKSESEIQKNIYSANNPFLCSTKSAVDKIEQTFNLQ